MLRSTIGQKVITHTRAVQKEAVPGLTEWRDDALVPFCADLDFVDALGQTDVQRQPDGLGAVVDEDGTDGHAALFSSYYMAIVYSVACGIKLTADGAQVPVAMRRTRIRSRCLGAAAQEQIDAADRERFIEVIDNQLLSLHEGNIARYRLRPSEFHAWQEVWK